MKEMYLTGYPLYARTIDLNYFAGWVTNKPKILHRAVIALHTSFEALCQKHLKTWG